MSIAIDNYEDYEAVIVGRVAKMRDCTPADLAEDVHLYKTIKAGWAVGMAYMTVVSLIEG